MREQNWSHLRSNQFAHARPDYRQLAVHGDLHPCHTGMHATGLRVMHDSTAYAAV